MSEKTNLLVNTIRAYEHHLMNSVSDSQRQTENRLLETLREMDEQQRVDSTIKWNEIQSKINRISTDLQHKTTKLRDHVNVDLFQMMNRKLAESKSEMENKFEEMNKQLGQVLMRLDKIEKEMKRMDDQQRSDARHVVQRTIEIDERFKMIEERLDKIESQRHRPDQVATRPIKDTGAAAGISDKETKNWVEAQSTSQLREEDRNGESEGVSITQDLGPLVRTLSQTYTQLVKHVKTVANIPHYNIVLLGESSTAKTVFLNNIHHLLKNSNTIHINKIEWDTTDGISKCMSYEFQFEKCILRFINSAGYGTPTTQDKPGQTKKNKEMTEQDRQGLVQINNYIKKLKTVHGTVIVVKTRQKRPSSQFASCVQQLIRQFDKSFANNLIFAVTEVDRSQSKEVKLRVEEYVRELSQATGLTIPPMDNTFLIYNNKGQGSEMSEWTWKESAQQCQLLLSYIMQLKHWKHSRNSIIRTPW